MNTSEGRGGSCGKDNKCRWQGWGGEGQGGEGVDEVCTVRSRRGSCGGLRAKGLEKVG